MSTHLIHYYANILQVYYELSKLHPRDVGPGLGRISQALLTLILV